ncbi:short transient receptor potential channel 6-like isoform X2 [Glandiceps talaboti]
MSNGVSDSLRKTPLPYILSQREKLYLEKKTHGGISLEFIRLVETGKIKEVTELLKAGKVNVNVQVQKGRICVTPLLVAAEVNSFHMMRCLLEYGAQRLSEPTGKAHNNEDITVTSQRLLVYNALCCPAYICLVCDDSLLIAIEMAGKMKCLSNSRGPHDIYQKEYSAMSEQLEQFAIAMLELCDGSKEVVTLLQGFQKPRRIGCTTSDWNTVRKAINGKLRKFLSHTTCQHVLRAEWSNGQPQWSENSGFGWTVLFGLYCFTLYGVLQPLLAFFYIFLPFSPVSRIVESPFSRFFMNAFSYAKFLVLLVLPILMVQFGHPNKFFVDYIARLLPIIWTFGLLWGEIQKAMTKGVSRYMCSIWNFLDMAVIVTFVVTLVVSTAFHGNFEHNIIAQIAMFDSSACFYIYLILRILRYLYLNPLIGPILLTFVHTIPDVLCFFTVFLVVVLSFVVGLMHIYFLSDDFRHPFKWIDTSFVTLLWTVFGKRSTDQLAVHYFRNRTVYINGTLTYRVTDYGYIQTVMGYIIYGLFCMLSLTILLNLFIAMVRNTYVRIQQNIDSEWKFVRTSVWMEHIRGPVLPPPYNLIPHFRCIQRLVKSCFGQYLHNHPRQENEEEELQFGESYDPSENITYNELVRVLTMRYISKYLDPHEHVLNVNSPEYECLHEDRREATITTL